MKVLLGAVEMLLISPMLKYPEGITATDLQALYVLHSGEDFTSGALYTTLKRLRQKGVIIRKEVPPQPKRGGRSSYKLYLTGEGRQRLEEMRMMFLDAWDSSS